MALLDETIKPQVRELLEKLEGPVKLVVFSQGEGGVEKAASAGDQTPAVAIPGELKAGGGIECEMCSETRQLAEEVAELSDQISIEVLDFVKDEKEAQKYGVDKIPAIAVLKGGDQPVDYGIRLYGIPSGYEFSSLLEDILMAGRGKAEISSQTQKELEKLDKPVHIQVYVTPT